MTRNQRRSHLVFWLVLGPVLLVGIVALLANRPPVMLP